MSVRNELEQRINEENLKIATLREQADRTEAFVKGLQEALKMIPNEVQQAQKRTRKASKLRGTFRPGSDVDKVYHLLIQAMKPMHIGNILVGIGKEDTKPNRMSLSSTLSRYVRSEKIFSRPEPNSFAIKDGTTSTKTTIASPALLHVPKEFGAEDK